MWRRSERRRSGDKPGAGEAAGQPCPRDDAELSVSSLIGEAAGRKFKEYWRRLPPDKRDEAVRKYLATRSEENHKFHGRWQAAIGEYLRASPPPQDDATPGEQPPEQPPEQQQGQQG